MSPLDTSRITRSTKLVKWLCSVECDSLAPGHCRVKTYRYIENLSVRGEADQHEQEGGRGVKGNWQHVSPLQPQGSLQESLHDGRFLEVFTKPPPDETGFDILKINALVISPRGCPATAYTLGKNMR